MEEGAGWGWRTGNTILAIYILGQLKDVLAPVLFPRHFRATATGQQPAEIPR